MISGGRVRLRPRRLSDAVRNYTWRTDPELCRLNASSPLTINFILYLAEYACELGRAWQKRKQFAIDTLEGEHIGNCAYHSINNEGGEAEFGIIIGNRSYWGAGYGADAINTLIDHIFRDTKLERIFLKVLDFNKRAQGCFAKCGFTVCGELINDGHNFVLMELYRYRWQQIRSK